MAIAAKISEVNKDADVEVQVTDAFYVAMENEATFYSEWRALRSKYVTFQ